jgi:uncharacterized protein (TIGR00730 family)
MTTIEKLTVYLGSSGRCRPVFKETAMKFGHMIGNNNKHLVYGGMDAGLMGIVANNALESGAHVTGVIPKKLKDSERIHPSLSETILVPDLWERKLKMFRRADAIIVLPGGYGTIDEALEALYWASLGAHAKPVIFLNTENYWDDFISYLKSLPDLKSDYLLVCKTGEEVFDALEKWQSPDSETETDELPHFEDDILQDTKEPIILKEASIKNSYYLATALGLKQLDKHQRHIGLLNDKGQFDPLITWIETAKTEHFITDRCTELFSVSNNDQGLHEKLDKQKDIHIDLGTEKWGPSETSTHIEIKETK